LNGISAIMKDYWGQRHLVPKGAWLLLISYSLVAFGSPMPPKVTWLEILMGCGLLMGGFMLTGPVIRAVQQQRSAQWCLGLTALLFLIPLCVGLLRGNAMSDIARDIFPLIFLLMIPFLLTYSTSSSDRTTLRTLITVALVFVGICTAVTFFLGALNLYGSFERMVTLMQGSFAQIDTVQVAHTAHTANAAETASKVQVAHTAHTANAAETASNERFKAIFLKLYDPAMLFASIFLSAWGVVLMVKSWREWLPGIILAMMGASIAYGFMIMGLRAYTAFFALAILTMCLYMLREQGFYIRLLPVVIVSLALFWPQVSAVLQLLWAKQEAVGANGKSEEWLAVLKTITEYPHTMLFGIGWGGTLENPIYEGSTRFTHSALSYYLLKSGVLGLITLLSIIVIFFLEGRRHGDSGSLTPSRLIILVSCLPPLLIGVLFEPTYKMLSYGVILALFVLALPSFRKITL